MLGDNQPTNKPPPKECTLCPTYISFNYGEETDTPDRKLEFHSKIQNDEEFFENDYLPGLIEYAATPKVRPVARGGKVGRQRAVGRLIRYG